MFGSLRVANIGGIPIRLHFSLWFAFLVLILQYQASGLAIGVLLFGSVLLHELAHAMVARRLGFRTRSIDLHLLGGAAIMEATPRRPSDELFIAAAGPAMSLALALVFGGLAFLTGGRLGAPGAGGLLAYAGAINLGLGLFNLVPALPMDGGRIFRAVLVRRFGRLEATRLAAKVARFFAVGFGVLALVSGSWSLALIGGFIWFLAGREARNAELENLRERVDPGFSGFHRRRVQVYVNRPRY